MGRFPEALDDYRIALHVHGTLRRTLRRETVVVDGEQEVHLLIAAAGFALSQEEYALTRRLLAKARRVVRRAAAAPAVAAFYDYMWAAYLDLSWQPERALQPALRAAASVPDSGAYYGVRMNTLAALLAMDVATTHEEHSVGRITHLEMAARCLRTARRILEPTDRAGKGAIELRQARLDALRHREARALKRVGAVEQLARELGDSWLLALALTEHGQLLEEHQEDWESSLRLYHEAQAIAAAGGMPQAGLSARRAMRRLEERPPHEEP